jgi:hypothetical protein
MSRSSVLGWRLLREYARAGRIPLFGFCSLLAVGACTASVAYVGPVGSGNSGMDAGRDSGPNDTPGGKDSQTGSGGRVGTGGNGSGGNGTGGNSAGSGGPPPQPAEMEASTQARTVKVVI